MPRMTAAVGRSASQATTTASPASATASARVDATEATSRYQERRRKPRVSLMPSEAPRTTCDASIMATGTPER